MSANEREISRPNIVFILTDDQGFWSLGSYGNREIRTPNLDRLAASGTRFDDFFCVSPVCSPARASILTGTIPSRHGVHDYLCGGDVADLKLEPHGEGRRIEYLEGRTGYTDLLSAAGYVCGISGKWHLGDSCRPQKGMSFWDVHAKGGGPYYGAPMVRNGALYEEPGYVTDVITDHALSFLDGRRGSPQPFYLGVHYTAPHSPWTREHHPAETYDGYHRDCPFESVPNGLVPPDWVERLWIPVGDEETRRAYLSGYYAAVTEMDRNVGRLLSRLEENGFGDNTWVVFTSDNGMNMGHHGVYGKGNATFPINMFEESVRVPFIVSRPGGVSAPCRVSHELCSHYDVFPTFLEIAGIAIPESLSPELPGHSFLPLLNGKTTQTNETLVVFDEYGPVRMIRSRDWKYVHRYPYGLHELFNLSEDPGETRNRCADPACRTILRDLKGEMDEWFLRYADPAVDGAKEPVTGCGQKYWAGVRGQGNPSYMPVPPSLPIHPPTYNTFE